MPDNSADYEDSDELQPDFDEDDHPARVWNLLWLINPGDEDAALQQFDAWREARAGNEEDATDEPGYLDGAEVRGADDVTWRLDGRQPGETVTLTVEADGRTRDVVLPVEGR